MNKLRGRNDAVEGSTLLKFSSFVPTYIRKMESHKRNVSHL